jgi:hypothetical protein
MKGGLEKAGHSIKKGVEEANKNLNDARSRHGSPEKKKSTLKSSAAPLNDDKGDKAHTTTVSEKKSDKASTVTARLTSAQESHQTATRPSSVHSDKSSRASLRETATPGEAPVAPRSSPGTPAPPPPPPPPPPAPKSQRASERASSVSASASAAAPAAVAAPPSRSISTTPVVAVEEPPRLQRTPSSDSNNSLHFSEADAVETPGSIRFTVEPESALRKPSAAPSAVAAPSTTAAAPAASSSAAAKKYETVMVEEVKNDNGDDNAGDLTTESSLDIKIEEDDDDDKSNSADERVEAASAAAERNRNNTGEGAKEGKMLAKTTGKKAAATADEADQEDEVGPLLSSRQAPRSMNAKGAGKASKKSNLLRSRASASHDGDVHEAAAAKPTSARGGKGGVTFAMDEFEKGTDKKDKKKEGNSKASPSRDDDDDRGDDTSGTDYEGVGKTKGNVAVAFRHHNRRGSRNSEDDDSDGEGIDATDREEGRLQLRHRGFRLSPAKDNDGDDTDDEAKGEGQQKDKRSSSALHHRHSRQKPASKGERRESPRSRASDRRHDTPNTRATAAPASRHNSEQRHLWRRSRWLEEEEEEPVGDRRRYRISSDGAAGGTDTVGSAIAPSSTLRRYSARLPPQPPVDGGALVEECLRDTEGFPCGPVRRGPGSAHLRRSAHRGAEIDGEPVQRRSTVYSTYQLDYPDWSRYDPHEGCDTDNEDYGAYASATGAGVARPAREDCATPRGGSGLHPSPHRSPRGSANSSFHRLSFYDEDDLLAAEAVAEPERFRAHSASRQRRSSSGCPGQHDDGCGSGGEAAMPHSNRNGGGSRYGAAAAARSPSASSVASVEGAARRRSGSNEGWVRRQRAYDVAGRRPSPTSRGSTPPHYDSYYRNGRHVTPSSGRHRYDAPRPSSPPRTAAAGSAPSSPFLTRRRSSFERTGEGGRMSESLHRLAEDRADPDYYFSDAPRERQGSASWHPRSRGSAFAPSPPRSPLWAHRSSFGRSVMEVSSNLSRVPRTRGSYSGVNTTLSPLRGRRASSLSRYNVHSGRLASETTGRNSSAMRTLPGRHPSANSTPRSEEEILEVVEWKLDVLGQQIAEEDQDREQAMLRSPFERLYHLNNRRDRDERRKKVFQFNRLERIRDRIVSGSLEEDIARREERLRKQEEMLTSPNGVFLRLYQNTSGRRSKAIGQSIGEGGENDCHGSTPLQCSSATASPNMTSVSRVSSRPSSATRRTLSREERLAMCDRLYGGALASKDQKESRMKEEAEERRQHEVEELLIARLVAQLQLRHSQVAPRDKKPPLTLAELEREAHRELEKMRQEDPKGYEVKLLRGRVLSAKEIGLASKRLWKQGYISKETLATRKAHDELRGCTFRPEVNEYVAFGRAKAQQQGGGKQRNDNEQSEGSSDEAASHRRRNETDRCKELYRKGMKAKVREAELRDEHDREARLKILRGRMASDHHFRRRVELDPSLAERFMKSLVV